jgi:ubiquitin C-terminal hydrolase
LSFNLFNVISREISIFKASPGLVGFLGNNLGLCGFKNFGNTCWLNSSIQCLLKTIPMRQNIYKDINHNSLLTKEWVRLVNGVYEENCIITPLSFLKGIIVTSNKHGYMFNFNRQNDVQEFLVFFIDTMHEELKRKVNITITGKIINDLDKMAYDAMKEWKNYFKNNYSSIIELFYGQLVSHIKAIDEDINYANTLNGDFYNSNDQFENSKENIFAKSWQLVCDDSNLSQSNFKKPFKTQLYLRAI